MEWKRVNQLIECLRVTVRGSVYVCVWEVGCVRVCVCVLVLVKERERERAYMAVI